MRSVYTDTIPVRDSIRHRVVVHQNHRHSGTYGNVCQARKALKTVSLASAICSSDSTSGGGGLIVISHPTKR